MFAPFRRGKIKKEKQQSLFTSVGDIAEEIDHVEIVDNARHDDLILSRYATTYKPEDELVTESTEDNTETRYSSLEVPLRLENDVFLSPSNDNDTFSPEMEMKKSSTKFEYETAFDDDNEAYKYDRTNPLRNPGFDLVDRVSETKANIETPEEKDSRLEDLGISPPIADGKDDGSHSHSPVIEHKDGDGHVPAILFTEEDILGESDPSLQVPDSHSPENNDLVRESLLLEPKLSSLTEPKPTTLGKSSGRSAKDLLQYDLSAYKEENLHPNALPPPVLSPPQWKDKDGHVKHSNGRHDSRFDTVRASTLPLGILSPPQPPVRTIMEYSYAVGGQVDHRSLSGGGGGLAGLGQSSLHQGRTGSSYTSRAPAPFTIYEEGGSDGLRSGSGSGLGSGSGSAYRLNSRSSNGSNNSTRSNGGSSAYSFLDDGETELPFVQRSNNNSNKPSAQSRQKDSTQIEEEDSELVASLFSKVRHNRMEIVQDMLEKGKVRASRLRDENGNTLLHVCAQNNLRKMASLVLSYGCEINALNFKSCSALDYAERYSFGKLADWLRSKGALPSAALQ